MQVQMDGIAMTSIDAVIDKGGVLLSFRQKLTLSSVGSQQQNGKVLVS